MKKKNYPVFIAIALIALLIVAAFCMTLSKNRKNEISNPNNELNNNVINSGDTIHENSGVTIPNVGDVNVERDDDGNKINISKNINKKKMSFGHIDLTDISISYTNGESVFAANVKNNSDIEYPQGIFLSVKFLNEGGETICEIPAMTSSTEAHGESNLRAKATIDFSNASTIDVRIIEQ